MSDFKPSVKLLRVDVRRVVRTAPYESYEVALGMDAEPDPNFSTLENLERLQAAVRRKVDAAAEAVLAAFDHAPA